ncbi:tyrosine-type recombinase/integrase [Sphingobium sp. CR28]|uniref:tyrosine-type recombinase/integrase n=1 Tax=Sphingobium sp. CR28 TaxID=3400272 RepID=UPI003FEE1DB8
MTSKKPLGRHADKRLSAAQVRALIEPGLHGDGQGLYLKIDKNGAKRWIQRLVIRGKRRDMGLGSVSLVSLAEAREKALENRKIARLGGDPLAAKKALQAILTFEEAAHEVHAAYKPTWRNPKHGDQWINSLTTYVFPHLGKRRIDTITSADVLAALNEVWNEKPETARRLKQRVGTVLKWAIAKGWRTDNPADALSRVLPKHDRSKVQHRQALPYEEVAEAIKKVKASEASTATKLAFEFLVLTATRSAETREAVWSEIDLDKAEWTIPASRMKAKKPHRVPLSPRCLAILKEAQQIRSEDSDFLFPGSVTGKPLSDMTLSKLMRELSIPAVPHGFRSSFRDWASEQTSYSREVIEFSLAHVLRDKTEAAYLRTDMYKKRQYLMNDWSLHIK